MGNEVDTGHTWLSGSGNVAGVMEEPMSKLHFILIHSIETGIATCDPVASILDRAASERCWGTQYKPLAPGRH